jgi:Lhr-like helicase
MDRNVRGYVLFKTKPDSGDPLLELDLSNSKLLQWRFIPVAKRFGVIRKNAEYGKS